MSDKAKISSRQSEILRLLEWHKRYSSGILLDLLGNSISIATLKRDLSALSDAGYIQRSGGNKDSEYALTSFGLVRRPFDLGRYYTVPESDRRAMTEFNQEIYNILKEQALFTHEEYLKLDKATNTFIANAQLASETIYKKELERFVIEFSWKSSEIEGNTYTLLETERLIREGLVKSDKTRLETSMILNHKKAYEFIVEQIDNGGFELSKRSLETIHSILVNDLGVGTGLRKAAVGISGSLYRPLSLVVQIEEQLNLLIDCINAKKSAYDKALIAILGESYLQPFEDGNKRTARLLANGLLLNDKRAPLSYRSVKSDEYKEACLIFYEQNSIEPFKKLFIEQYIFAANNYNVAKNV